jgi:hypothetical protein
MFYWKYQDIPEDEITMIQQQYKKILPNNCEFFQVVPLDIKTFMGLKISRAVLIQVEPNAKGRIHTDFRPEGYSLALNIPLENCENSITTMWDAAAEVVEIRYTTNNSPYHYYNPNLCKKITEFSLTKPVLFDTSVPHAVDNYSDKWRKAISLRFEPDPWHLT